MKDFLNLPPKERLKYFSVASDKIGLPVYLVEKDFWVCWILKSLFTSSQISEHLTFKGGTSLSKVYDVITRFSEDIDLSIEKSYFGFINDKDPTNAPSNKKKGLLLQELSLACRACVQGSIFSGLQKIITAEIPSDETCELLIDESDPDGQTLLFVYPGSKQSEISQFINPVVKMEFGARGEHWPVSNRIIRPYLQEAVADSIKGEVNLRVLNIERTFWEKITILHMFANYPEEKRVPERQSRHYYDLYCLLNSDLCTSAKADLDLLRKVAEHKSIYFRAAWARYDQAAKGTLKLIPNDTVLANMSDDYREMKLMFFEQAPEWEDIVESLRHFENEFNSS